MTEQKTARLRDLTARLNQYRDEYYNKNAPSVPDEVYDRLFDELAALEEETGIRMANSPTQTVGYPAASKLEKTAHDPPAALAGQDQEQHRPAGLYRRAADHAHAEIGRPDPQADL